MCRSDDALYHSTVLPGGLKADQRSHDEKCVNWNEAAIREILTICAEAEIILQFSEMVSAALYTSHEMSRVFTGSLRVVCERTHRFRKITGSVNEPKSDHPGTNHGTHFPCIFRNGCVKEAYMIWFIAQPYSGKKFISVCCELTTFNTEYEEYAKNKLAMVPPQKHTQLKYCYCYQQNSRKYVNIIFGQYCGPHSHNVGHVFQQRIILIID